MFKSIRSNLVCAFALFLIGFVLLQIFFNVFFAENFYIMQKKSEINQVYLELKNNYSDNHDSLYSVLNKYEEKYNVRAVIFKKDTDVNRPEFVYASVPQWRLDRRDFFPVPMHLVEENMEFSENAKANLRENPKGDVNNLYLSGLIKTENGVRYVFLESSVSSIQQTVRVTTKINLFLLLGLVIIGMAYFYFYACRLTKPIKEVDEVAQSVVNLDFSKRAGETGKNDEISHLALNINIMSDRISSMINELQTVNKNLVKDIEYKTKLENIRKEFVANVSHELKTPLALLMGYGEMLKSDIQDLDKEFYYDVIIDESEKMNQLVSQLLEISKMENELAFLNFETVDLYDMVLWTLEKNKILIEQNEMTYKFNGEHIICTCDKMKIEQAVTNYITNAVFHSKKGSKMEISLIQKGENLCFSVYNEGSYINEADMEKIWNIFYKADKSRSERKSTGLGLYVVSSVINAHKGEYGVKNRDNGVEFYFEIKTHNL